MKKYIDRDALVEYAHSEYGILTASDIMGFPTADVQPVKYGRWEINCDGYYPYCSNCKNEPQGREMTLYCPNCGSKNRMGGDSDE